MGWSGRTRGQSWEYDKLIDPYRRSVFDLQRSDRRGFVRRYKCRSGAAECADGNEHVAEHSDAANASSGRNDQNGNDNDRRRRNAGNAGQSGSDGSELSDASAIAFAFAGSDVSAWAKPIRTAADRTIPDDRLPDNGQRMVNDGKSFRSTTRRHSFADSVLRESIRHSG